MIEKGEDKNDKKKIKKEKQEKVGTKETTKKMRWEKVLKVIGFILILVVLAGAVTFGVYFALKSSHEREDIDNLTYVGILEDGTYYIPKARKDIRFPVDSLDTNSYILTNENNENVESSIVETNGEKLIQASTYYNEGETYTLELTNTNFTEERLKDAKKLKFKIEETEKAKYALEENVKVIPEKDLEVQETEGKTTANIQGKNINEEDILLIEENNDYTNAYQVESVENGIANLEIPEVSEIYNEFDLYNEEKINFNEIEINQDLESEIQKNVKQSAIYQMLVNESYAAENVGASVNVIPDNNKLTIEIKIEVKASGKEFLGIQALKNHDMVLKYTMDLEANMLQDIEMGKNINIDLALKQGFQFDVELTSGSKILEGVDDLSDEEYCKTIQDIIEKLESAEEDASKGKASIGGLEVPTGIPGVNAYFDIYFQTELGIQATLTYQQRVELSENIGIIMNKDGISPYATMSSPQTGNELEILGKINMTAGVGFDVGISIISKDLAHVNIGEELGIYGEAFATMTASYHSNVNQVSAGFVGRIEAGLYLKTKYSAGIDIFFVKAEKEGELSETKIPFIEIGTKEIPTGIKASPSEVTINNNQITAPTISKVIYNISTKEERQELCSGVIFVDSNGNNLTVSDNKINLGTEENTTITAIYMENGKTYQTEIKANKREQTSTSSSGGRNLIENTGTQNSKVVSAYEAFIRNKEYVSDKQEYQEKDPDKYCIFDINQDGTEELLLMSTDYDFDEAWKHTMIYTYISGKVTLVENISSYGEIRYQKDNKEIVHINFRPFKDANAYGFFKLEGDHFICTKVVGLVDTNRYELREGDTTKVITAEESASYYKDLYYFAFKDISSL